MVSFEKRNTTTIIVESKKIERKKKVTRVRNLYLLSYLYTSGPIACFLPSVEPRYEHTVYQ